MKTTTRTLAIAAAAAALLAGGSALAQTSVGEITVIGPPGPNGQPSTLSRTVYIGDIDLRTDAGVSMLRTRVMDTAEDLCAELGETGGGSGIVPSCKDDAFHGAMNQAQDLIRMARSDPAYSVATAWVIPAAPAPAAESYAPPASATVPAAPSYTVTTVTNGPVPDTPENRARFGGPLSHAGRMTTPAGN